MAANTGQLSEYTDDKRLQIHKLLLSACTHLYSKGKLQEAKFADLSAMFADLAKHDPLFLAALAAWSIKTDSKDLPLLSVYFNALSDGDGTPFAMGESETKPNLRLASSALLQQMDIPTVLRVTEFAHRRWESKGLFDMAYHKPRSLATAFEKYLRYREENPEMLWGIRRSGLAPKYRRLYRQWHLVPSDEAAAILGWNKQKDGRTIEKIKFPDFDKMDADHIVTALQESKMSGVVALSVIPPKKITAKVARALLERCSGNQSIILYRWFAKNGFLDVKAIKELFAGKIQEATTAVDRIDTLTRDATREDQDEMAEARSKRRKSQAGLAKIGKIFVHLDISGSMERVIEFAKERGSIFAECVENPVRNFNWGFFNTSGAMIELPEKFTKGGFSAKLFGLRASGGTDCIACYGYAREFGADVDVYLTDGGHNMGGMGGYTSARIANVTTRIEAWHTGHPAVPKPRAAVIVWFESSDRAKTLEDGLKAAGIPVSVMTPEALSESALVAQSVRNAVVGELSIIDEIMNTPLPKLPRWWNSVGAKQVEAKAA